MLELARTEATGRVAELERPEEVARLLEVGADGEDLVDQVLHTHNAELAEMLLDDGVVGERDAVLVDSLSVAALVDEFADRFEVRVPVGNEGFDDLQHFHGGLCETNEDAIVDLEKTKQLEGLALLGINLVDTLDADDEGEFGLCWDVVGAFLLGDARETDLLALSIAVLLDVAFGALKDLCSLLLRLLCFLSAKLFD